MDKKICVEDMSSMIEGMECKNWWEIFRIYVTEAYEKDEVLLLAADIGKTLLEENKNLEETIKLHKKIMESQAREIEDMKKQSVTLKEMNTMGLQIYNQVEASVRNLQQAYHKQVTKNKDNEKLIESQSTTIKNLETNYQDLQKKINDLTTQHTKSTNPSRNDAQKLEKDVQNPSEKQNHLPTVVKMFPSSSKSQERINNTAVTNEIINKDSALQQLQVTVNSQIKEEQYICTFLEELNSLLEENYMLEDKLLEKFKNQQLCTRCLQDMSSGNTDQVNQVNQMNQVDQVKYDDMESLIKKHQRDSEHNAQVVAGKSENTNDADYFKHLVIEDHKTFLKTQDERLIHDSIAKHFQETFKTSQSNLSMSQKNLGNEETDSTQSTNSSMRSLVTSPSLQALLQSFSENVQQKNNDAMNQQKQAENEDNYEMDDVSLEVKLQNFLKNVQQKNKDATNQQEQAENENYCELEDVSLEAILQSSSKNDQQRNNDATNQQEQAENENDCELDDASLKAILKSFKKNVQQRNNDTTNQEQAEIEDDRRLDKMLSNIRKKHLTTKSRRWSWHRSRHQSTPENISTRNRFSMVILRKYLLRILTFNQK